MILHEVTTPKLKYNATRSLLEGLGHFLGDRKDILDTRDGFPSSHKNLWYGGRHCPVKDPSFNAVLGEDSGKSIVLDNIVGFCDRYSSKAFSGKPCVRVRSDIGGKVHRRDKRKGRWGFEVNVKTSLLPSRA